MPAVPTGAFQTLLVGSDRVASLIADPRVAAVTLTGSEGAGVERRPRGRGSDQEDRARARRQRPVRRHAERGPGGRRVDRREGAHAQQRPVLHRGQAVHRPRGDRGGLRAPLRREDGGAEDRRPDGRLRRDRPAGDARDPGGGGRSGAPLGRRGRPPRARREAARPARQLLRSDRPRRRSRGQPRGAGGDLRSRREPLPREEPRRSDRRRQPDALRTRRLGLDAGRSRARASHPRTSRRAPSSSTGWSRATRACPSAASRSRASAASSRCTASASSSTSRRSGSRNRRLHSLGICSPGRARTGRRLAQRRSTAGRVACARSGSRGVSLHPRFARVTSHAASGLTSSAHEQLPPQGAPTPSSPRRGERGCARGLPSPHRGPAAAEGRASRSEAAGKG